MGAENDPRVKMYQDFVLNNEFIAGLRDLFRAQDAATKIILIIVTIYEFLKQVIHRQTGSLYYDAVTKMLILGAKMYDLDSITDYI